VTGGPAGGDGGRDGDRHARSGGYGSGGSRGGRHSPLFLAVAGTLAILLFATFVALGTWQLKRRVWKLDLIARVEQRVHAPPMAAPGPAQWPKVSAATDEYRHVTVTGKFLDESQTLVQAVTELGAGYWVLTPLRTADGGIVMVNRGFIPAEDRERVARGAVQPRAATAAVIGLLRMPEPRGAFLRHNDAAANHWYSRDVQAIAAARGLTHVAPYFIDAEAALPSNVLPSAAVVPVAGLTVIAFHNSHLVYAVTWYTLALMVAGAIWLGIRSETRT
jgi:surfeit locus 1 family protein